MNEQLEKNLFLKYEDILDLDNGFECLDGWFDLINKALFDLKNLNYLNLKIVTVKEKFGGLRIYTNQNSNEINNIILTAEKKASITCEICGKLEAKLKNNKGWLVTKCSKCK